MKNKIYIWIVIVALAVGIVYISTTKATTSDRSVIAVLLPITGDAAVYGEAARNATLLASSSLSHNILIEDTALKGSQAISALKEIQNKKIGVVISFSSGETLAICPITESLKTLLLSSGSSPSIGNCGPMTYSNFPSDVYQAEVLANKINKSDKIAVLYIQNDYGTGLYNEFKKNFTSNTLDIAHPPDTKDFRTTLAKIKEQGIENLLIISHPKEASLLLKQANDLGLSFKTLYGTESLKDDSFVKNVPSKHKDVFLTLSPASYSGKEAETFKRSYTEKFGQSPAVFADYVYDNVILADQILKKCKPEDSGCIQSYLQTQESIGTTGKLQFGKRHSPQNKDYAFYRISGDTFVEVK